MVLGIDRLNIGLSGFDQQQAEAQDVKIVSIILIMSSSGRSKGNHNTHQLNDMFVFTQFRHLFSRRGRLLMMNGNQRVVRPIHGTIFKACILLR